MTLDVLSLTHGPRPPSAAGICTVHTQSQLGLDDGPGAPCTAAQVGCQHSLDDAINQEKTKSVPFRDFGSRAICLRAPYPTSPLPSFPFASSAWLLALACCRLLRRLVSSAAPSVPSKHLPLPRPTLWFLIRPRVSTDKNLPFPCSRAFHFLVVWNFEGRVPAVSGSCFRFLSLQICVCQA